MSEPSIIPVIISAASGLVGVGVGGWITIINQRHQNRKLRVTEQLQCFYGPMLALRAEILNKTLVQKKLITVAGSTWSVLASSRDYEELRRLSKDRFPEFEKVLNEGNGQLETFIMPRFEKMVELFTSQRHLIELSTAQHYPALLEYVEIWNRHLAGTIPSEILSQLEHSERNLFPLYEDLQNTFNRLQQILDGKRRPLFFETNEPMGINPFAASRANRAGD